MANEKEITPKEITFVDLYFEVGFNATEAYMRLSGKCERATARNEGAKLLQRMTVRDEIERRMKEYRAKRRMSVEDVADLIQDFATVEISEIFDENGDMKPLSEMTQRARRCIAGIETEEKMLGGEPVLVKKIKLVDRKGAAELLGKYKKMFTENVDLTSGGKPLRVAISITGKGRG